MKKYSLYFLLAVSLLAAGCNKKTESPKPVPQDNPSVQQQAQKLNGQDEPVYITIYQTVEGSNLNNTSYRTAESTKALTLLKSSHKVEAKDYGSLGEMVTSIDGNAASLNQFWAFYVNGNLANEGASSYILKNNDKVEWKLNSVNSYEPNSK